MWQARLLGLWNSPTGPKTVHFWGPLFNAGFIVAAVVDMKKPPDMISGKMTVVLAVYSMLFMRFSWMVIPRNYFLLGCHICNEAAQLVQLTRKVRWELSDEKKEQDRLEAEGKKLIADIAQDAATAEVKTEQV